MAQCPSEWGGRDQRPQQDRGEKDQQYGKTFTLSQQQSWIIQTTRDEKEQQKGGYEMQPSPSKTRSPQCQTSPGGYEMRPSPSNTRSIQSQTSRPPSLIQPGLAPQYDNRQRCPTESPKTGSSVQALLDRAKKTLEEASRRYNMIHTQKPHPPTNCSSTPSPPPQQYGSSTPCTSRVPPAQRTPVQPTHCNPPQGIEQTPSRSGFSALKELGGTSEGRKRVLLKRKITKITIPQRPDRRQGGAASEVTSGQPTPCPPQDPQFGVRQWEQPPPQSNRGGARGGPSLQPIPSTSSMGGTGCTKTATAHTSIPLQSTYVPSTGSQCQVAPPCQSGSSSTFRSHGSSKSGRVEDPRACQNPMEQVRQGFERVKKDLQSLQVLVERKS